MNVKQQVMLADVALKLRYPGGIVPSFEAEQLLSVRRPEDEAPTLWNVFNRVQENVLSGGFQSHSFLYQRRGTVRQVERVDYRVKINRGLWDAAMAYLPRAVAPVS